MELELACYMVKFCWSRSRYDFEYGVLLRDEEARGVGGQLTNHRRMLSYVFLMDRPTRNIGEVSIICQRAGRGGLATYQWI